MSKNIIVLTGSARQNSNGRSLTDLVAKKLNSEPEVTATVVNVAELNLPFYNAPTPPSSEDFVIEDENVKRWSETVSSADGIVFIMPEYNHSLTAIQKNAIDWLYKEWQNKPAAVVAYGAYAGKHSIAAFKEVNDVISTKLVEPYATYTLGKELNWDGTIANQEVVEESLNQTAAALTEEMKQS